MKATEIKALIKKFESLKVLVIGDLMLDKYVLGKATRLSPEAPVPIVAAQKTENYLGGAGNVLQNLFSLGAQPIICSVLGKDDAAQEILELLKKQQLNAAGILQSKDRKSTVKTRVIGNNHQLLRIDDESSHPLNRKEVSGLIELIQKILKTKKIDVVIFEDYDKGVITQEVIDEVIKFSQKNNIPVAVDPKKRNFHKYHHVDLFKPNFKELVEGLNLEGKESDLEINSSVRNFMQTNLHKNVLLTLSERGVRFITTKESLNKTAHLRQIADVSGAGDTVIAVAALALALKQKPAVIAEMANIAGGIVCEYVGVVPLPKKKFEEECIKLMAK